MKWMAVVGMILGALAGFLIGVPVALANGLFISTVWNWLAVPAFDAPALTIPNAIALTMLVSFIKGDALRPEPKDERETSVKIAAVVVYYASGLLFAYVLRGFVT
jgi:hypothetical protein